MIYYKTPFRLQALGESVVLAYEVPMNTVAQVRACTFHNASELAIVISVYIGVSDTDSPPPEIIKKTLTPGESYLCPELANHNLQAEEKVWFSGMDCNVILSVIEQAAK